MKYKRNWAMEGIGEAHMENGSIESVYYATNNKGQLTCIEFNHESKDYNKRQRIPATEVALKAAGVKSVHFSTFAMLTI